MRPKEICVLGGDIVLTLECNIDHTIGLFRRFALFHTCIDQKVNCFVYSNPMDSYVVYCSHALSNGGLVASKSLDLIVTKK